MHRPRFPRQFRLFRVRAAHAAVFTLVFTLVAGLACDENAPTETRTPAGPTDVASGDEEPEVLGDVSAMAIALPVDQSVATTAPAPAFRVRQTGTGPDGIFQISRSGNTQTALQGLTNGRGRAGFFRINNTLNTQPTLGAQSNGTGYAVQALATGAGGAGSFRIDNVSSTSPVINAFQNGLGPVAHFELNNQDFFGDAFEIFSHNDGRALHVRMTGQGTAASIQVQNFLNAADALQVGTNGDGNALVITEGSSVFNGNVKVNGTLTKTAGSFRIDHPLDPEHKYLSHSFVESPDMKNVYDGTVTLDASGRAAVELPEYFEALNKDFRYQLTAIGAPGPDLYVAEGVKQNRFKIAGGRAYARVSWMVTGIRQDAYANEHRIKVEEEKPPPERNLVARR